MKTALCLALSVLIVLGAGAAVAAEQSEIVRFAVVIGNDLGDSHEVPLRYAESDAGKMAAVLSRVGGFAPENVSVLRGRDAHSALRALIAVNDRIRTGSAGRESVLFVYYSGHGDRSALHLGKTRLELAALEQLVRGSAATVRLLVVDACHSGALTRVKGGRRAPRMAIDASERLSGEGIVFLTSSSASERAQESDELGSSFFTHYFTSGLLGAADHNEDGVVVLKEAYRHAYENTIRASSRTEEGIQHPTFRYELGGQGDIVLSRLTLGPESSSVRLPNGIGFVLFKNDPQGPVVIELGAADRSRTLHLEPGHYHVRGRGPNYLLEGALELQPGARVELRADELERVDYARMVRRGGDAEHWTHGPVVGYRARTAIARGASMCQGPFAGYLRESSQLRLLARMGACRGSFENPELSAATDELSFSARAARAWDTRHVTFDLGLDLGLAFLRQTFDASAPAPARNTVAPLLALEGSAIVYLPAGFHVAAELAAIGYALAIESASGDEHVAVRLAARAGLALGLEFASF